MLVFGFLLNLLVSNPGDCILLLRDLSGVISGVPVSTEFSNTDEILNYMNELNRKPELFHLKNIPIHSSATPYESMGIFLWLYQNVTFVELREEFKIRARFARNAATLDPHSNKLQPSVLYSLVISR